MRRLQACTATVSALAMGFAALAPGVTGRAGAAANPLVAAVGDAAIVEGNAGAPRVRVPITLSAPATETVVIGYSTRPGSALVGTDFIARSGSVTIAAGATSSLVSIGITTDRLSEGVEKFDLRLTNSSHATIGRATGAIRILDDDPTQTRQISVGDGTVTEGASGYRRLQFSLTLTSARTVPVTVGFATAPTGATAEGDYTSRAGTATIAPGTTSTSVGIWVRGDEQSEANETLELRLNNPTGASPGRMTGIGTIRNDDGANSPPGPPLGLEAVAGDRATALRWNAPESDGRLPITAHAVHWSSDGGATWSPPAISGALREYVATGLVNGSTLRFEVAAVNAAGTGPWSSPALEVTARAASGWRALSTGGTTGCGITDAGGAQCWGFNASATIGDGTRITRLSPVSVVGLEAGVQSISTGALGSCALTFARAVWCWGLVFTDGNVPVPITGLSRDVREVSVGRSHACAVTGTGGAVCWGLNYGNFGDGTINSSASPVPVLGLASGVTTIAAGNDRSCAGVEDGARCWGENGSGALGDGSINNSLVPVTVTGFAGRVVRISTAGDHTCAILQTTQLVCWGANGDGQIGNGTQNIAVRAAAVGRAGTGVLSVSVSGSSTCAVIEGSTDCWGYNPFHSAFSISGPYFPFAAPGLELDTTQVSSNTSTVCALRTGEIWCLGQNTQGEMGDGTTSPSAAPVVVLRTAVPNAPRLASAAGESSSIALRWQAGPPVRPAPTGYRVRTSDDGGTTWVERGVSVTPTDARIDGFTNGVSYLVEVAARNELGIGDWSNSLTATPESAATSYRKVSAGRRTACGITRANSVRCWGSNSRGQVGDGTTIEHETPVDVAVGEDTVDVAVGQQHACAVTGSGGVRCWGANQDGQLGDGTTSDAPSPVSVAGLPSAAISVTAGADFTCALLDDGTARCWGNDQYGQLGDGGTVASASPVGVSMNGETFTSIDAGFQHTCALTSGGGVRCWGSNFYGEIGTTGTAAFYPTPTAVSTLDRGVGAVSAGDWHNCAVVTGVAQCWGSNTHSELGRNGPFASSTPGPVDGLSAPVQTLDAGTNMTCASSAAIPIQCWGGFLSYRIGPAGGGMRAAPVPGSSPGTVQLAMGDGFGCRLAADETVACWGDNSEGELGDGTATNSTHTYVEQPADQTLTTVQHGDGFACGLTTSGGVRCWGRNDVGQLGDGTRLDRDQPGDVHGLTTGVTSVAVGTDHVCARYRQNFLTCWGGNVSGQLGLGVSIPFRTIPEEVSGINSAIRDVSAGNATTCIVQYAAATLCWGQNPAGVLGAGGGYRSSPTVVPGATSSGLRIATGGTRGCALGEDGAVSCWGANYFGQVGDGTRVDRPSATPVQGLSSGVTDLAVSDDVACATLTTGEVRCWGAGTSGLGDGTTTPSASPVTVVGLPSDITEIAVAGRTMCARTGLGELWCWGANQEGTIGDGTRIDRLRPVRTQTGIAVLASGTMARGMAALTSSGNVVGWGHRIRTRDRLVPTDITG